MCYNPLQSCTPAGGYQGKYLCLPPPPPSSKLLLNRAFLATSAALSLFFAGCGGGGASTVAPNPPLAFVPTEAAFGYHAGGYYTTRTDFTPKSTTPTPLKGNYPIAGEATFVCDAGGGCGFRDYPEHITAITEPMNGTVTVDFSNETATLDAMVLGERSTSTYSIQATSHWEFVSRESVGGISGASTIRLLGNNAQEVIGWGRAVGAARDNTGNFTVTLDHAFHGRRQ